jgi:hypothetical protein
MTTVTRITGTRFTRIILIATAALAAGLFAFPAAARADGEHGHGNGRGHGYGHSEGHWNGPARGYSVYPVAPRPVFVAPRAYYRPYYSQPYYGGHVYYPPRVAFGINFGSPGGVSFGGYYASPGYIAPAPYPYVATPVPPPYYGPDVYYRGRHCDRGEGYYDGY